MSIDEFVRLSGALLGWIYMVLYVVQIFYGNRASRAIENSLERKTSQLETLVNHFAHFAEQVVRRMQQPPVR